MQEFEKEEKMFVDGTLPVMQHLAAHTTEAMQHIFEVALCAVYHAPCKHLTACVSVCADQHIHQC